MPVLPMVDADAGVALRAWRTEDAPALAAAWADPEIARHATVPGDASVAAATRWIGGAAVRTETGVSLDLVVGPAGGDEVWGEVGLARLRLRSAGRDPGPGHERVVSDVGWWVVRHHRSRGVASAAVGLLVAWARDEDGLPPLIARIRPGHIASEVVATRAGFTRRGRWDADHDLWLGSEGGV